jgi:hypothetical protein
LDLYWVHTPKKIAMTRVKICVMHMSTNMDWRIPLASL